MANERPGVFINEVSTLPASVVSGATAVPAFVGYTEQAQDSDGNSLTNVPTRITSMNDYQNLFGGAETSSFTVNTSVSDGSTIYTTSTPALNYRMYHSVLHYFNNGGGDCYIVSVGGYNPINTAGQNITSGDITGGLDVLKAEDGPTLIVTPDAVALIDDTGGTTTTSTEYGNYKTVCDAALAHCAELQDRFTIIDVPQQSSGSILDDTDNASAFRDHGVGINNLNYGAAYYPDMETTLSFGYSDDSVSITGALGSTSLGTLSSEHANSVKSLLDRQSVELPPSGAVAGIIAATDLAVGAWKAPANVSVNNVTAPAIKVSNSDQDGLNVDAGAGKSINAIRAFEGKGTLVWGARTLAGNDNEWRYVPVRRLFLQMERDIKKATYWSVFEPNTSTTWAKIRSQVESYLTSIWQQGGLAGSSADEAYFVKVGLGESMDSTDILEGRLLVTIGAAAVRPAEFITFTFTHKLQES